jgi:hypothetical protein
MERSVETARVAARLAPALQSRYLFSSNGITLCDTLTLLHILETAETIDNSLDGDVEFVWDNISKS